MSGTLLVLLGVWGALIPFIGPYFDYAYTPDNAWDYTNGRLILEVLPGAGAVLGGLLLLSTANRAVAMLGGWLAAMSGAWFVLGVPLSRIWENPTIGEPIGGTSRQVLEYVGFFGGLGVVIVFLAALALGRFAVVGVRETRAQAEPETSATPEQHETAETAEPTAREPEPAKRESEPAGRHGFRWRRSRHVGTR